MCDAFLAGHGCPPSFISSTRAPAEYTVPVGSGSAVEVASELQDGQGQGGKCEFASEPPNKQRGKGTTRVGNEVGVMQGLKSWHQAAIRHSTDDNRAVLRGAGPKAPLEANTRCRGWV